MSVNNGISNNKGIITIILTDGPYISEYAEMAYRIAKAALKKYHVNIFLYLDAVHIPKVGQNPAFFANAGQLFWSLPALEPGSRPVPGAPPLEATAKRMETAICICPA